MSASSLVALRELAKARPPLAALVLGSGLNGVTEQFPLRFAIPFIDLPDMPMPTVAGHPGRLCLREIGDNLVLVFQGRLHYYEGYSREAVVRPIQLAAELGARTLVLTNAAGGIGARQGPGMLMAVRDHIAANRPHWWRAPGPGGVGPLRPSRYSPRLLQLLQEAAAGIGQDLPIGVYAGVTGPNYETPAEVRALMVMGADAVGMSTVDEADAAFALGMEVAAISCIANRAAGLTPNPLSHTEVLATVHATANNLQYLLHRFLAQLCQ